MHEYVNNNQPTKCGYSLSTFDLVEFDLVCSFPFQPLELII